MAIPSIADDQPVRSGETGADDRDERRIKALQRTFRRMFRSERQLGVAVVRKIGAALLSEPARD